MVLHLRDIPVYNVETGRVYSEELLPGLIAHGGSFGAWMKYRYSSGTNTIARNLIGLHYAHAGRKVIDANTYALSLSDCYWVKALDSPVLFRDVTPYCSPFWAGVGVKEGKAAPTLYVGGYLSKKWDDSAWLCKYGSETLKEELCYQFCKAIDVPCAEVQLLDDGSGVRVRNITNLTVMLEQLDASGFVDPDTFTADDIVRLFGWDGARMLIVDGLLGNGDRHAGNIAFSRSVTDGSYLGLSKLYDFDHAFDATGLSDALLDEALDMCLRFKEQSVPLLMKASTVGVCPIAKRRAEALIAKII